MAKTADDGAGMRRTQVQPKRWLPLATAVLTAAVIAALAYYCWQYFQDSSYQDDRAFRVLGQVVGQFSSLQEAIGGAARLAPSAMGEQADIERYRSRLALTKANLRPCTESEKNGDIPATRFGIDASDPQRTFTWRDIDDKNDCRVLTGELVKQLPTFFAQDFFDATIITGSSGKTIATLARQGDSSPIVALHEVAVPDLIGGNAGALLHAGALWETKASSAGKTANTKEPAITVQAVSSEKEPGAQATAPLQATAYDVKLGGETFRAFVLPFQPPQLVAIDGHAQPRLYVIGLKRQDYIESMSDSLGMTGAWAVTLGILLLVLAWPILSLRFSSPQEAITRAQMLAFVIALLLIPAVIATAGFSVWTHYRLILWADQQAESYSQRIEGALIQELDSDVHMLEAFAKRVKDSPQVLAGNFQTPDRNDCADATSHCGLMFQLVPEDAPPNWSPIRSATALNSKGESRGLTFNFFSDAVDRYLKLGDREYFQAIITGGEWRPTDMWHRRTKALGNDEHPYVAQRLFNRADAARVLQIAVPIDAENGERLGIVTGDARVYGLTASIRVPLLRFAIFDSRTGALLFHTDDRLSLAENFLVETEGNESLREAMTRRASGRGLGRVTSSQHFNGRYLGAPHRFYVRPIAGAPWSVAIFYPEEAIDSIVMQTTIATLATFFAYVCIATMSLILLVLMLPARADVALLRRLWPQWVLRERYLRVGLALLVLLMALALVALGRLNRWTWLAGISWSMLIASCVLGTAGFVWIVRVIQIRRRRAAPPIASIAAYRRGYVSCTLGLLCLLSAYPALWLGVGFHDTAVRAFMRDELQAAAGDAEKRRLVLLRDLRRLRDDARRGPSAAALSQALPVPGYQFQSDFQRGAWRLMDVEPTPWLAKCGAPDLGWVRRRIWTMSTARHIRANRSSTDNTFQPDTISEASARRTGAQERLASGHHDGCRSVMSRARLRSESGDDNAIVLTLASAEGESINFAHCGENGNTDCRDLDLRQTYSRGSGIALASVALICILLLVLLAAHAARYVFGIRLPFAGRFTPIERDPNDASLLLDLELQLIALRTSSTMPVTLKDEADWRAVKCRAVFERMWKSLSPKEQLFLHQLADGQYANPANQPVIEQLLRKGFLKLAPWPQIAEPGFAEFISTVEHDQPFDTLRYETSHTLWSQLRTPLLILVIIVAGMLMWLAGSTMQLLAGTLAGVAALFGSVSQVTNFINRDKPQSS
jgi:hypothetical protein